MRVIAPDRMQRYIAMLVLLAFLPSPAAAACPAAPAGYTAHPASCIGLDKEGQTCASWAPYQIEHGSCTAGGGDLAACTAWTAAKCDKDPACHSFAFESQCERFAAGEGEPSTSVWYQLFRLGRNSTVGSNAWVSYAKAGQAPGLPPAPQKPRPHVPPAPAPAPP